MLKKEFAAAIAAKMNITKKDAEEFVDSFLDVMTDALASGEEIRFTGFGTFGTKVVPAHKGTLPLDGSLITIPEKNKTILQSRQVSERSCMILSLTEIINI